MPGTRAKGSLSPAVTGLVSPAGCRYHHKLAGFTDGVLWSGSHFCEPPHKAGIRFLGEFDEKGNHVSDAGATLATLGTAGAG